jgi:hypothetical protein
MLVAVTLVSVVVVVPVVPLRVETVVCETLVKL